ncbi:MAG: hydantoinase/oxoprolinase family protein [Hyperthermus sp.]|nr:MAG: hydantoinase/oxoprolinase family protein [Hyperthermus sp.]
MRRVGVDVGGTFTDLVAFDEERGVVVAVKYLSSPREPWRSVIGALEELGWDLGTVDVLVHATTLGTNLFLGQVGLERPKVLLVTNKGFRDVLEIGRQNRPELYNLFFSRLPPLVPRSMRVGVRGRIAAGGEEVEALDVGRVRELARDWCGRVDVFAIVFLHSYVNPVHELRAKQAILEECPEAIVVASHEVDPQPREYERASTTVVNAVLKPMLSRYLEILWEELKSRGFRGSLLVMMSSGGLSSVKRAIDTPAAFVESGPAAGSVAVAFFSKLLGIEHALGFDMGGTTAKASAVINGEPLVVPEYEVGGRIHMGRLLRGTGYPIRYPHVDLVEVSAGGGTIAWIDAGGALRLGPKSAGSVPGPACYGRGGVEPTVTDAHLVLGRLPSRLAGGRVELYPQLARDAVGKLAGRLGLGVAETAEAIITLANTLMSRALRLVTVERGYDPRDFTLFAYGGAGPLHAAELAAELGLREVIVPPFPGVFSALGLVLADFRHDMYKAIVKDAEEVDDTDIEQVLEQLREKAIAALRAEGIEDANIVIAESLDMRYKGQSSELNIPYKGSVKKAIEDFHKTHASRYGFSLPEARVQVVNVRLTAYGLTLKPKLPRQEPRPHKPLPLRERRIYTRGNWTTASVYRMEMLKPGATIKGPSIIEGEDSTIYVPENYEAYMDEFFAIHLKSL